jgi:hypothetical protein
MLIDKGTRVGGVMQELGEGGLGRFAPEPLPRMQAAGPLAGIPAAPPQVP